MPTRGAGHRTKMNQLTYLELSRLHEGHEQDHHFPGHFEELSGERSGHPFDQRQPDRQREPGLH